MALDADGEILYARIAKTDLARLNTDSLDALLDSAQKALPIAQRAGRVELYVGPHPSQSGPTGA